jgi:hypothetical protein
MVVGNGEEEVPERAEPVERPGFCQPGMILGGNLFERWIGMVIEILPPQLVINAVVNRIHPFDKGFLGSKGHRMLFVEVRQRGAAVFTGQNVGDCFEEHTIFVF